MGHVVSLHEVERVVCCMHLASHSRRMLSFDAQEMPDHLISQATMNYSTQADAVGGVSCFSDTTLVVSPHAASS
jgi:hypothetical protein